MLLPHSLRCGINKSDSFELFLLSLFFALYYEYFSFFQPPSKRFKLSYTVPAWESSDSFDPLSVKQHSISWVHHDGKPLQPGFSPLGLIILTWLRFG